MELQEAYKIIGVHESATMKELDEQYDKLLRRESDQLRLDQLNEAYRIIYADLLKDHEIDGSFRKKFDNFLYHYKKIAIFGVILLIVAGSLSYSLINSQIQKRKEANLPPPNLEIMILGDYMEEDFSLLEQRILDLFPTWDSVDIEFVYAPKEAASQLDIAAVQKSAAIVATETPDLYIFDSNHYDKFVESGPFLALDQIEADLPDDVMNQSYLKYFQQETDTDEHLYGIDLIDHELFHDLAIEDDRKIAAIRTDTDNTDHAIDFLTKLLK